MIHVRPPAVAGRFYPADPQELAATVASLIGPPPPPGQPMPKALIAPHAGYIYSGSLAGAAYGLLAPLRGKIERVALLGPSHRIAFEGMATTSAQAYETPLGGVPIDHGWLAGARDTPRLGLLDEAHAGDHALEVHLPFLQSVLGDFKLIPIICGQASGDQVAALLDRLWGGPETLIVISSDLSHFLDYEACRVLDAKTTAAIERLDPAAIGFNEACGRVGLNGLLVAARRRGLRVTRVGVCNSGDTAGPRDRVVGYGAWAFYEPSPVLAQWEDLARRHRALMTDLARRAILEGARGATVPSELAVPGAAFVTLHKAGLLRGCYGSVSAHRPLAEDILINARHAAFGDPRFAPLEPDEWGQVTLSVTLLTPLEPMTFRDEAELLRGLQPRRDGLVIEDAGRRALFLPAVWDQIPDRREFLRHLKVKAGLSPDHWSPDFRASRFVALEMAEEALMGARDL